MSAETRKRIAVALLSLSAAGFATWKANEGDGPTSVRDDGTVVHHPYVPTAGDVPTIGHGSTRYEDGTPVRLTDPPIPRQRAQQLARNLHTQDEKRFKASLPGVLLHQGEYDLYEDFVGQYGIGNWRKPGSPRTWLLRGDYPGACEALLTWRFQAGRDCRLPQNWGPQGCRGVWTRQQRRHAKCVSMLRKRPSRSWPSRRWCSWCWQSRASRPSTSPSAAATRTGSADMLTTLRANAWKYTAFALGLGLGFGLLMQTLRLAEARLETAHTENTLQAERTTAARAALKTSERYRKLGENHRDEIAQNDAAAQAALAAADAGRARAVDARNRLQRDLADYLTQHRAAAQARAAAGQCAPDTSAADLLADLFRRADERAGELAHIADNARPRGLTCERDYDSARAMMEAAQNGKTE